MVNRMKFVTPEKFQESINIPRNKKTEEAILNHLDILQSQLNLCQEISERKAIQQIIDENFLTLGVLYHSILYEEKKL